MCNPLALGAISAIAGVGQAAIAYQGAAQAAATNEAVANANFAKRAEAIGAQGVEVEAQKSEDTLTRAIERARAAGRIAASATELGATPRDLSQQLGVNAFQFGREETIAEENVKSQRRQLQREFVGGEITRQGDIASRPAPSKLSAVLGISQGALSGVNTYAATGGTF